MTKKKNEPLAELAAPKSAKTKVKSARAAKTAAKPARKAVKKIDAEGGESLKPRNETTETSGALALDAESAAVSAVVQFAPAVEAERQAIIREAAQDAVESENEEAPSEPEPGQFTGSASDLPDAPESEAAAEPGVEDDPEFTAPPRPPAKLERLQKILAAAGVASRRSAEAMIEQGRVQVNGKVVTVLGTKADAGRDHIRVDGKLLQGAERHRYFVLNKPRGFVTTVKDPEGRPTVMQFFDKMKERLYPVGRLDYMSEGLLVVTNDGELANRLTKASSGVEKTYLVKVAGQPTEAELNILRGGVAIERGKPGSPTVRTSPARIRQVRQGDNPWYEVVLIEGRNRELRKMFEEVGHFVEKIRRTGYGPLVLDQEPGNLRELEPGEVELLRKAAEGKLRTPKSKDIRRRNAADAGLLPTVLPKPSNRPRPSPQPPTADRPAAYRPIEPAHQQDEAAAPSYPRSQRKRWDATKPPKGRISKSFGADKPFRPARPASEDFRPAAGRTSAPNPVRSFSRVEEERPRRTGTGDAANFGTARPAGRSFDRPAYDRPRAVAPRPGSAGTGRTGGAGGRPFPAKPAWKKPERAERADRPPYQRSAPPRREAPVRQARDFDADLGPVRPPNLHIEEIPSDRPTQSRPFQPRENAARASSPRPTPSRPSSDRPRPSRPDFKRPAPSARPGAAKPFRGEGGLARPFTTSSGKPRPGGARPSSKPGSRPYKSGPDAGSGTRPASGSRSIEARTGSAYRPTTQKPYPNSGSRAERKAGPGWKPKPSFSGAGRPASGSHSRPKPGGFSKSGYKGKPPGKPHGGRRPS